MEVIMYSSQNHCRVKTSAWKVAQQVKVCAKRRVAGVRQRQFTFWMAEMRVEPKNTR